MSYEKLLIWQYKTKPKAYGTAKMLSDTFNQSWEGITSLPYALSVDDAEGVNLDLVGKHVGQSRILSDFHAKELFGFQNAENALGFNVGTWYRAQDSLKNDVRLNDIDYRFLIKCRIAKNYQLGTIDDVSSMLAFVFGSQSVAYDNFDMSISVLIESTKLTAFKRYVIKKMDILPRPVGVNINFYLAMPANAFGFHGAPNALGFNTGIFTRFI